MLLYFTTAKHVCVICFSTMIRGLAGPYMIRILYVYIF
jgi:hypothetical protein